MTAGLENTKSGMALVQMAFAILHAQDETASESLHTSECRERPAISLNARAVLDTRSPPSCSRLRAFARTFVENSIPH
jgi:hypothetical protein